MSLIRTLIKELNDIIFITKIILSSIKSHQQYNFIYFYKKINFLIKALGTLITICHIYIMVSITRRFLP